METLLKRIKAYIEETEVIIDGEWGRCRNREELIKYGRMPKLYNDVVSELSKHSLPLGGV